MKKIIMVVMGMFSVASLAHAEILHCKESYQGKPFVQVTIWSDLYGFGALECDYKNPQDQSVVAESYPSQNEYYVVAGHWRSTMPGFQWCSVKDGNQYDTCLFAKREKAK
jgi:hypothetical protein